jgi:tetratricopeptide (TPR) repeat protein
MQIYQQLAQEQPDKLEYQHKIALMHGNIGALQGQQKLDQQAEQSQRQAVEMLSQVVAADAQTKVYHSDLALAYNNLGRVQAARGSDVSAIESYQKAIAGLSELIRRYPGDINDISNLGGMYNNLAMTLRTLDQLESAATALEKAIELQRQAYEAAPEVGQFRAFLNNHYYNYGELLRKAGRVDEAVKVAFQRKSLQPAEPEQCASVADEVARSAQQLHLQSPTSPTARRYYSEARTLYQQAAAKGWKAPATGRQHESLEMLKEFFGSVELPERRAESEADVP